MIEVKGRVVADAVEAVQKRHGLQAYNAILALLDEEARALFRRTPILASEWFPLDAFAQFLEKDLEITAQGDERVLTQRTEALIGRQLGGAYKTFVKMNNPEFVLERIGIIHNTYFRGLAIETISLQPGKAVVRYTGFEKQHRLVGLSVIGFYRKALEMSGAKNVRAKYMTRIEDDKGYCELLVRWESQPDDSTE